MKILKFAFMLLIMSSIPSLCAMMDSESSKSYIDDPPVFFENEQDVPLTVISTPIPKPGVYAPDIDLGEFDSDGFRSDGQPVQPQLFVNSGNIRVGVFRGFTKGWGAGLSLPWVRTKVGNYIGGLPASGIAEGLGDLSLLGKKNIWSHGEKNYLNAVAGIELPTGRDDSVFSQSNPVTNAYYQNYPSRMPISWQPGSGSVNGYLGLVYGKRGKFVSYAATLVGKLYSSGDEDVKVGNILIFAGSGTYGVNKNVAVSLAFTLRNQADDSYPNISSVMQPFLEGTTTHGTTFFIDPSARFRLWNKLTVGLGYRIPVSKPDNGLVPDTRAFLIFYPDF